MYPVLSRPCFRFPSNAWWSWLSVHIQQWDNEKRPRTTVYFAVVYWWVFSVSACDWRIGLAFTQGLSKCQYGRSIFPQGHFISLHLSGRSQCVVKRLYKCWRGGAYGSKYYFIHINVFFLISHWSWLIPDISEYWPSPWLSRGDYLIFGSILLYKNLNCVFFWPQSLVNPIDLLFETLKLV